MVESRVGGAGSTSFSGQAATGFTPWNPGYGAVTPYATFGQSSPVVAPSQSTPPTAAGLEPAAYEANPYGKLRPKFIGGEAWIGGRIIEGPFFGGTQTDPTLTAIYYLAEAANPSGTRTIPKFAIRGAETAFDGSGNLTDAKYAGATVEFKTGTSPQTPCQQSIDRYGANAIGYTRGILIAIKNLPLRPSAGMVPLISGFVSDTSFGDPSDGTEYNDLLGVILRDCRYATTEYEVDVSRTYRGMILANSGDLIAWLQNERKILVHMAITFSDKVRIVEPTTLSVDAEITNDNAVRGSLVFTKADSAAAARKIQSTYIDKDRDYQMNVVTAQEDVFPYPATSAVQTENVERAVISDAAQETADVHIALYERLAVRSNMDATLLTSMFGTEVGDGARFADHDVIGFVGRALQTQHDYQKWQVQVTAAEVLNCGVDCDTPPDDALAYIDFTCPQYFVGDTEYAIEDILGGAGSPEVIADEGLKVDGVNGSWPNAAGDLFDLLETLVLGDGFTIVYEFKTIADDVTGYLMYAYNAGNTKAADLSYDLDSGTPSNNFTRGSTTGSGSPAVNSSPFAAATTQRVAYTFERDPTFSDGGHQAISVDGQAVDQRESDEDLGNLFAFNIGHALNGNPAGFIRKIIVYALRDDADLPGLSEAP